MLVALVSDASPVTSRDVQPARPGEVTSVDSTSYAGLGPNRVPHYAGNRFSAEERRLLRQEFGIERPELLYLSDSSRTRVLKYDSDQKRCAWCYVDTYAIGYVSLRQPGESWNDFYKRIRKMRPNQFPESAFEVSRSLDDLDPDARPAFDSLLAAGARAGFRLSVGETYRSPEREALLLDLGHGRTFTATSMHSYGRAIDIRVGDGNPNRAATRREWVAFRRLVLEANGGQFHILGAADVTWDWSHVDLPARTIGFHSISELLSAAQVCARAGTTDCHTFPPHLPALLALRLWLGVR